MPMKRQWLIIFFPENSMEERCSAIKGLWKQRKIKRKRKTSGQKFTRTWVQHMSRCFTPGLSVDESYESLFKPELKEEWKQKLAQAELTAGQAEGLKTLRAMWKQDPAGQLERAGRLVGKWKDEYRVTQG